MGSGVELFAEIFARLETWTHASVENNVSDIDSQWVTYITGLVHNQANLKEVRLA